MCFFTLSAFAIIIVVSENLMQGACSLTFYYKCVCSYKEVNVHVYAMGIRRRWWRGRLSKWDGKMDVGRGWGNLSD